jgi:Brp/Blh family beta-carotene 15,15'-monooxygenase
MTKSNLILWAALILILSLAPFINGLPSQHQDALSVMLILLFGIPHGALDEHIQLNHSSVGTFKFYTYYLGAIGVNVALWFIIPPLALIFFLLLSAYHFGQSQFEGMFRLKFWPKLYFLIWGVAVLSIFLFFNHNEFLSFVLSFDQMYYVESLFSELLVTIFFAVSLTVVISVLLIGLLNKQLDPSRVFSELLVLLSVCVLANVFSFLFGFALFFIIIHAYAVTLDEFKYLSMHKMKDVWSKVKKFMPLTLLAFFGLGFLYIMLSMGYLKIDLRLLFLIVISSITVPHAFVMNLFYKVIGKSN